MPMDSWDEIRGYKCELCKGPATHFYGGISICCDCHADEKDGGLLSKSQALANNPPPHTKEYSKELHSDHTC